MKPIEITADDFVVRVRAGGILVLDFWASRCGPCRSFAPIFEAAAERHPDVTWGKVDTEARPELASALDMHEVCRQIETTPGAKVAGARL